MENAAPKIIEMFMWGFNGIVGVLTSTLTLAVLLVLALAGLFMATHLLIGARDLQKEADLLNAKKWLDEVKN